MQQRLRRVAHQQARDADAGHGPQDREVGAELPGQGRDLVAGGPLDEVFDRVDIVQGLPAQAAGDLFDQAVQGHGVASPLGAHIGADLLFGRAEEGPAHDALPDRAPDVHQVQLGELGQCQRDRQFQDLGVERRLRRRSCRICVARVNRGQDAAVPGRGVALLEPDRTGALAQQVHVLPGEQPGPGARGRQSA